VCRQAPTKGTYLHQVIQDGYGNHGGHEQGRGVAYDDEGAQGAKERYEEHAEIHG